MNRDRRPLVIGVGNRWRGDDGIGPCAIDALARVDGLDADLVTLDGEPARLVAAWRDQPNVIVVDAIVDGDEPGTVHVLADGDHVPPATRGASSHAAGIADAIALGRAVGHRPGHLTVVGVEPDTVAHGQGLSPSVAASLDAVVRIVEAEVARCV